MTTYESDSLSEAIRTLCAAPLLDQQAEQALTCAVAQGCQEARERLITANTRLVVRIARQYQGGNMELLDLIQEGNIGLMCAVGKFDYTKGNRFSTYATWWIRQSISRALREKNNAIRLPVHASETLSMLRKIQHQSNGDLTAEELAEITGLSIKSIRTVLRGATMQPVSLDRPLACAAGADKPCVLADSLPGTHDTEAEALRNIQAQAIRAALDVLDERERAIIELRFGLKDGQTRTLEQAGAAFGITRERARQIEAEAKEKLARRLAGWNDKAATFDV